MAEGFLLRVKYVKHDRLAYLSHLETVRSVERIIRRAQLPYAITEGFNPHMKIAFGPALPVGAAGDGEYVDVRMREYVPAEEALERLQQASAPNLCPIACEYVPVGSDAITVTFPLSDWRAEFLDCDIEQMRAAFDALLQVGHIEVVRKKKKPKQVEFEGRLVTPPVFTQVDERVVLHFTTKDWGEGALRPDKFIAAAVEGMQPEPQLVYLVREELRSEE